MTLCQVLANLFRRNPMPESPDAHRRHEPVSHAELNDRLSHYVTHGDVDRRLQNIERHLLAVEEIVTQIGENSVSTQQDVDALTQAVSDLTNKITADDGQLQQGVAAIEAWMSNQPASVDVSGLQSAVSTLSSGVDQLSTDASNVANLVPPATS